MLKEQFTKKIPQMVQDLSLSNIFSVPRIEKVVVNIGLGRVLNSAAKPKELLEKVSKDIALITGQKPLVTKAKKSIASFKLRAGTVVGLKVTLRGKRMYDFLDRLIQITLPRSRDFKGLDLKTVDQSGNLTIGIKEHTVFPEVTESTQNIGLEITVVSRAHNREEALLLFRSLGFPLKQ